jgi:hypothetical protein
MKPQYHMVCTLSFALLAATSLRAAEYFVGPSGDDQASGSLSAPWKTVQHAAQRSAPGDMITVLAGDYTDQVPQITTSGEPARPLTIQSKEKHAARIGGFLIKADHITISGFHITEANKQNAGRGIYAGMVRDSKHPAQTGCTFSDNLLTELTGTAITSGRNAVVRGNIMRRVGRGLFVNGGTLVENNEIDTLTAPMVDKPAVGKHPARLGPRKTAYAFFAGDDITFRGNHWHGTYDGKDGAPTLDVFYIWGTDFFQTWDAGGMGSSNRILIENNRCFYATHAIEPIADVLKQSHGITVRNNLLVNTCYVGVFPRKWTGVIIENNTLINCGAYPVWSTTEIQSKDMIVRNNLIATWKQEDLVGKHRFTAAESGIRFDQEAWVGLAQISNNLIFGYKNRGYSPTDFVAEPQFVDPDNGDFRLKPGSPGIDAGATIDTIKTDLEGTPRPQGSAHDVGAYESKP